MNKYILFFAVITVAAVAEVYAQDTEEQGGNSQEEWDELVEVLQKACAKILAAETADSEETSNNIRDERMFRRDVFKRETSDDGIDIEIIARLDGATIIGNALGLACVGLAKLETEQQEQETANRELRHQGRSIW